MDASSALPLEPTPARVRNSATTGRLFYASAAGILLVLMLLGFEQFYRYGRAYPGREIAPPIRTMIIVHGITMSAWVLLFLVQPLLIVNRKYRVHRQLGVAGAVLAVFIVVLGVHVGIEATRIAPPELRIWTLTPRQFLIVNFVSMIKFAGFIAIGVWKRNSPDIHRPMMLLATLSVIPAAVARIDFLSSLYVGTAWETTFGPFLMTLVLGALFLLVKWLLTRTFDRPYAIGYVAFFLACLLTMVIGRTAAWERFAGLLVG